MLQPKLFKYGIQLERSDIRVHVSPATRRLYVFQTIEAQKLLERKGDDYPEVPAFQSGVEYPTAAGKLVPHRDIPGLHVVDLTDYGWWANLKPDFSTSKKGLFAVKLVCWALRNGRLPLWVATAKESRDAKVQIKGTDIQLWAHFRIQVKCDWQAGPKEWGGSGHLFLQSAELNPRKRH